MYNIHVSIYIATAKAKVETAKMLHALQGRQAEFEEKLIEKKEQALKKEDDMRQEKAGVSHDMNPDRDQMSSWLLFMLLRTGSFYAFGDSQCFFRDWKWRGGA
jgi:hypothetical protein